MKGIGTVGGKSCNFNEVVRIVFNEKLIFTKDLKDVASKAYTHIGEDLPKQKEELGQGTKVNVPALFTK